jgi:hypothetical protein
LCCFCCSLSDGERERLRFDSTSGMAKWEIMVRWARF